MPVYESTLTKNSKIFLIKMLQYQKIACYKTENNCPILFLPVLSKILKIAVHKELMKYSEANKFLNMVLQTKPPQKWHQHCFVIIFAAKLIKATLFCNNICHKSDKGSFIGAVYINLSKDTTGHEYCSII